MTDLLMNRNNGIPAAMRTITYAIDILDCQLESENESIHVYYKPQ